MPGPKPLAIISCALLVGGAAAAQVPPFGGEFQANTYTTSTQRTPAVASSGNGKFIVVWSSFGQDGDRGGIYGQRYDASGQKAGSEFRVSSSTTGSAQRPSIAMAKDGSFVVAWDSYQDLFGPARPATPIPPSDIFARRFASDGTPLGEDFQVNTYTTGYQYGAVAAIDDAKEFVIVWQGGPSGAAGARRYDAAGAPTGDEFALGTSTGLKRSPAVAMRRRIAGRGCLFARLRHLAQRGSWRRAGQRRPADVRTGPDEGTFVPVRRGIAGPPLLRRSRLKRFLQAHPLSV
ncbi:MAG TPA: hypothetical protein VIA45_06050, partial [Thermoanaerobaculia bacterium]